VGGRTSRRYVDSRALLIKKKKKKRKAKHRKKRRNLDKKNEVDLGVREWERN